MGSRQEFSIMEYRIPMVRSQTTSPLVKTCLQWIIKDKEASLATSKKHKFHSLSVTLSGERTGLQTPNASSLLVSRIWERSNHIHHSYYPRARVTNRQLRSLGCIGPHKAAACRSLRVLSHLKRRRVRNGIDHSIDQQYPNSPAESPCTAFIRATRSHDARRMTKPRMLGETAALKSGTEIVLAAVKQACETRRLSNTISICEKEIEATRTLTTRV